MSTLRSSQCPSCGAAAPASGREGQPLICPYCSTLFSPKKSPSPTQYVHFNLMWHYWKSALLMVLFLFEFTGGRASLCNQMNSARPSIQTVRSEGASHAPPRPSPTPETATTPRPVQVNAPPQALFRHHSTFETVLRSTWILGEVTNTSTIPIAPPQVVAILLDDAGKEMQAFRGYPPKNRLEPGEKSPILIVLDHPPKYHSLLFETSARKADAWFTPAEGLKVEPNPTRLKPTLATLEGKVSHQGNRPAHHIRLLGVAYSADNRVLSMATSVATPSSLQPGEHARYQLSLVLPKETPARYEAVVMAQTPR